jgi:hypothetical protein
VFVGSLCAVAFFLYAYKGYSACEDRFFSVLATFAIVVVLFSMNLPADAPVPLFEPPFCHQAIRMEPTCSVVLNDRLLIFRYEFFGYVHYLAASALFISLGYASIHFFTKSDKPEAERGQEKRRRNTIYRVTGYLIWGALAAYGVFLAAQRLTPGATWVRALEGLPVLFFVENVCLEAFGLAWLLKGDGVWGLSDRPH